MQLIKIAKIKLNISLQDILPTFEAYTRSFNFVAATGFPNKTKNGVSLHKKTYATVRAYLPSQLAISSRSKAAEALAGVFAKKKKYYSCPNSKLCSIRYDCNSYSLNFKTNIVSLLTINGRKKYSFSIPKYYKELFTNWKYGSAELLLKKKKYLYLHISFSKEIPDLLANGTTIGVDRGINNIAVCSNGLVFGGEEIKKNTDKHQKLRSNLQKCGTRSAKRHLRKLSGKEKRFKADINHQISKKIVASLSFGDVIVLEDLTNIRDRKLKKKFRKLINNWSFYQLEKFLIYKAANKGIIVVFVNLRYTSQTCSDCLYCNKGNRKGDIFCCKNCGLKLQSDFNASINIRNKYIDAKLVSIRAAVNQPIVEAEMLFTNLGS